MEIHDIEDSINTLIDKLINLLIKTQDDGNNFNETEHFINHCIFLLTRNLYEIFEWLKENQVKSYYQFFLGIIYYNVEKNFNEAYKLFYKASENNYPIAQVYLANCYKTGLGTEINYNLAFKWMQKAAENESICGQLNLGIYYDNSIGTDSNLDKAIYWHQKSANNGNLCGFFIIGKNRDLEISLYCCQKAADNGDNIRLHYLGEYYELGKKVNKDEIKASEYYKKSAENGLVNAKFYLGYSAENDKKFAFYKLDEIYELVKGVDGQGSSITPSIYGIIKNRELVEILSPIKIFLNN
ncbi:17863_t:CDS:2 [Funneliformis geosporum]|uniref:17863_t:CDS:1 n=1 Tax=Funneliformis geosporum TaxID=1117311 RepID=A0A9W4T0G6_9GLOM|nr:17863_t:CDS:2 [Funneliformis geosporum]